MGSGLFRAMTSGCIAILQGGLYQRNFNAAYISAQGPGGEMKSTNNNAWIIAFPGLPGIAGMCKKSHKCL
jgi:hypothetical protein